MKIENLYWIGYLGAFAALLFAFLQARKIKAFPEGNAKMIEIAQAIRTGANAFMKRQYTSVVIFLIVMFFVLLT